MIRNITGIGKGPYIAIHDGFQSDASWKDFLPGSDVSASLHHNRCYDADMSFE